MEFNIILKLVLLTTMPQTRRQNIDPVQSNNYSKFEIKKCDRLNDKQLTCYNVVKTIILSSFLIYCLKKVFSYRVMCLITLSVTRHLDFPDQDQYNLQLKCRPTCFITKKSSLQCKVEDNASATSSL